MFHGEGWLREVVPRGNADAGIKAFAVESPDISKSSLSRNGVDQNIAFHASSTVSNSAFLIFDLPVHSASFPPPLFPSSSSTVKPRVS